MAKFAYNNGENTIKNYLLWIKLWLSRCVFFENHNESCSHSKTAAKLAIKLPELLVICFENLLYTQKL